MFTLDPKTVKLKTEPFGRSMQIFMLVTRVLHSLTPPTAVFKGAGEERSGNYCFTECAL